MPSLDLPPLLLLFLQSMLIGLSIAAPVGPIGVLSIRRTLTEGRAAGIATGMGAALADAVYGAIGAYGATTVVQLLLGHETLLGVVGVALLLWLAWRTAAQPVGARRAADVSAAAIGGHVGGTFLLTLSNPATILSFMAVFGGLASQVKVTSPAVMVLGVLLGSTAWWLFLAGVVGALRERFDARWERAVNRVSAGLLAALAAWQALTMLR